MWLLKNLHIVWGVVIYMVILVGAHYSWEIGVYGLGILSYAYFVWKLPDDMSSKMQRILCLVYGLPTAYVCFLVEQRLRAWH